MVHGFQPAMELMTPEGTPKNYDESAGATGNKPIQALQTYGQQQEDLIQLLVPHKQQVTGSIVPSAIPIRAIGAHRCYMMLWMLGPIK